MTRIDRLISIIIPVYNVEKYIAKCIQSLLDQTYKNFEAIIVDDGSPDNSIQIAKDLVSDDPRFIFLTKENGGQASARNMGLDYALGEYITFVDADDYIHNNTFMSCINIMLEDKSLDIVMYGISYVRNGLEIYKTLPNLTEFYKKNDILLVNKTIDNSPCNKMYRCNLFNALRFKNGILFEDAEIIVELLYKKKLFVINDYYYYYVQRDGSTMHSYKSQLATDSYIKVLASYNSFLIKNNLINTHYNDYIKLYLDLVFYNNFIQMSRYSLDYKNDIKYLCSKLDNDVFTFKNIFKMFNFFSKKTIIFILFKINPFITRFIIRVYEDIK